ncbi:small serum protein 4-like [Pantherophis guttatus]|uniref:Small serum protein 4-like n=1 Tax=Pantherophis guttatus TaxID=94885 RepID=A0ABM3YT99_PANGU|nr:small serum protein 4-like [Pantherophis guttatus]
MKVFFILIIFSLMLATCQGHCIANTVLAKYKDGKEVPPSTCPDMHDGREHLFGSTWSMGNFRCECRTNGLLCCETSDATVESMTLPPNL